MPEQSKQQVTDNDSHVRYCNAVYHPPEGKREAEAYAKKLGLIAQPTFKVPAIGPGQYPRFLAGQLARFQQEEHAIREHVRYGLGREDGWSMPWPEIAAALRGDCERRGLVPPSPTDATTQPEATPAPWEPPAGYVSVSDIMSKPEFRKDGKNPPRTTIQKWADTDGMEAVKAPDTQECHYPREWAKGHVKTWNPRKA
jgi:hypothetical protein